MESPLFALSSAAFMAISGTVMVLYPQYRAFGWLFIATMLALFCYSAGAQILARVGWPLDGDVTRKTLLISFSIVGALVVSCVMFAVDPPWSSATKDATYATLRIQFFGNDTLPTEIRRENVTNWFAYYSPNMRATYKSTEDNEEKTIAIIPKTWAVFVVFDRPTDYHEITVGFSAANLPVYDILSRTKRSVIVAFRGDVPAGELEITTKGHN